MNRLTRFLLSLLVIIFVMMVLPTSFSQKLRASAINVSRPLLNVTHNFAIWLNTRYVNIRDLGKLYDQRSQLEQRVIDLEQQVASLSTASHDNALLRKELSVNDKIGPHHSVQAIIISRTTNSPLGQAVIDQGSQAGIAVGQAVISQGMLVGKVSQVNPNNAIVDLVTSPHAQIQAELIDTQSLGLVNGSPTGLRLTDVDQDITIKVGELVQTSGIDLNGAMPRGLVIGQVDRVISAPGQSHQEAIISSPIDFDNLRLVFVITQLP